MVRKKNKRCGNCNAWDFDGIELTGIIAGKAVTMHHCRRRCPQIVWMFDMQGTFVPDIATTFPATTADNYCMEFEKNE